uniref:non-specific serine/threonine protein kinase n=1 Tax=Salix viminalis TaxID=40686 RepID=A0A6N2LLG4_SALVM
MSPEYAMHGRFSEKSDVSSFGVLLLEIVSGRRSNKIDGNEQGLSLLEFAWKLWNEGNALALVDPALTLDQHSKLISEETLSSKTREAQATVFDGNSPENIEEVKLEPLFKLQLLETATNNFDVSNKLGQGGFGAVYRGKLPDGQEIAVKRLSRTSGQGLEELMNEVVVISKLQHRNLVRLLGCCVEGEEMMLVYEYMPNKSLDAFLFDSLRKERLDWERRFSIINGICRGLLYLHRDSRLRIIHRDLKPGNILLDHELNPKISDFGLARIFGGNEVNTTRVVGTFGFMPPEYLMEGRFSEKSDVFSFGVLLLQIVSGKRNDHFYGNEHGLSLIGFAWKVWNEGDITAFVDPPISDPCFVVEIFRCIQIGLLCVQELANDRPVVSTIISMLNSEIVNLPTPKKPAYVERQSILDTEPITQDQKINSINNVTISDVYEKNRDMKAVISTTVVSGAIIIVVGAVFWWRWMAKYRERKRESERILLQRRKEGYPIIFNGNSIQESMNQVKFQELPLFKLQILIAATDNFDAANKLGEGGFGLAYRGNLPDGQVVAVKRLSRASGQGQEEFMNEVVVISELQHRNLVRLLGCCVEGDEKMLVYEYMPNRSLDASLFDSSGMMTISDEGKLVVLNGQGEVLWSSNVLTGFNQTAAQLTDDGNLVLKAGPKENLVWQSFQEPTDTYLSKMRFTANKITGNKTLLTSWRSSSDPSVGNFSAGINPLGIPEFFMWYNGDPLWRSGPWVGQKFIGIPVVYPSGFSLQDEGDGTITLSSLIDPDLRLTYVLTYRGKLTDQHWSSKKGGWIYDWENCSCVAYSYYNGFGCMVWTGNLIDIQKFSQGGADLNIRLAYTEFDKKRNLKVIISMSVIGGATAIFICVFFYWKWMATHRERKLRSEETLSFKTREAQETAFDVNLPENAKEVKLEPLFRLQVLETATNNFHISNKLGQGGFGGVYRGTLPDGQEIAVKRLSRTSGQGLEELMNEVVVISKLQHRNLVRLLGCCVEGEEMMLVYEYMPNKSLDAFLFDSLRKEQLDWERRFSIINGICRGLLYLHRDSRLRIIHRDLKPNFGLARIFGGNEVNTTRVVGTFGYMAPEYLMKGRFSEKSDVFSFGVLLLQIVSGKRNDHFYGNEHGLSLIGFAWKVWNEGDITAFVDTAISDPCFQVEIFRCIQIGLLCVQELAKDRPVVSTIISMLNSEIVDLPTPKKPAFVEWQSILDTEPITQDQKLNSINNVTISDLNGR